MGEALPAAVGLLFLLGATWFVARSPDSIDEPHELGGRPDRPARIGDGDAIYTFRPPRWGVGSSDSQKKKRSRRRLFNKRYPFADWKKKNRRKKRRY